MVIRGAEPVIVDTGCSLVRDAWLASRVLGRRPRRRALDLHLPRRPRPHRQPRRGARALPAGDLGRQLGDDRPPRSATSSCPLAPDALARPGRRLRRRRPHACTSCARRCSTRRRPAASSTPPPACCGRSTRSGRWSRATCSRPTTPIPTSTRGTFDAMNTWNTPWLEWVDPTRFAAHIDADRVAPARRGRQRARPDPARRPHRHRRSPAPPPWPRQPALPTPGQAMLDAAAVRLHRRPPRRGLSDDPNRRRTWEPSRRRDRHGRRGASARAGLGRPRRRHPRRRVEP